MHLPQTLAMDAFTSTHRQKCSKFLGVFMPTATQASRNMRAQDSECPGAFILSRKLRFMFYVSINRRLSEKGEEGPGGMIMMMGRKDPGKGGSMMRKGEEGPGTRGERMMSSSSSFCRRLFSSSRTSGIRVEVEGALHDSRCHCNDSGSTSSQERCSSATDTQASPADTAAAEVAPEDTEGKVAARQGIRSPGAAPQLTHGPDL